MAVDVNPVSCWNSYLIKSAPPLPHGGLRMTPSIEMCGFFAITQFGGCVSERSRQTAASSLPLLYIISLDAALIKVLIMIFTWGPETQLLNTALLFSPSTGKDWASYCGAALICFSVTSLCRGVASGPLLTSVLLFVVLKKTLIDRHTLRLILSDCCCCSKGRIPELMSLCSTAVHPPRPKCWTAPIIWLYATNALQSVQTSVAIYIPLKMLINIKKWLRAFITQLCASPLSEIHHIDWKM